MCMNYWIIVDVMWCVTETERNEMNGKWDESVLWVLDIEGAGYSMARSWIDWLSRLSDCLMIACLWLVISVIPICEMRLCEVIWLLIIVLGTELTGMWNVVLRELTVFCVSFAWCRFREPLSLSVLCPFWSLDRSKKKKNEWMNESACEFCRLCWMKEWMNDADERDDDAV